MKMWKRMAAMGLCLALAAGTLAETIPVPETPAEKDNDIKNNEQGAACYEYKDQ